MIIIFGKSLDQVVFNVINNQTKSREKKTAIQRKIKRLMPVLFEFLLTFFVFCSFPFKVTLETLSFPATSYRLFHIFSISFLRCIRISVVNKQQSFRERMKQCFLASVRVCVCVFKKEICVQQKQ